MRSKDKTDYQKLLDQMDAMYYRLHNDPFKNGVLSNIAAPSYEFFEDELDIDWNIANECYRDTEAKRFFLHRILFHLTKDDNLTPQEFHDMNVKIPMINFNSTDVEKRIEILNYYLQIFHEVPSGSHMVRAYTQMEKIFMQLFEDSKIPLGGDALVKLLEKYDRIKGLAMVNENNKERRLAFYKSVAIYKKITGIERITIPEGNL